MAPVFGTTCDNNRSVPPYRSSPATISSPKMKTLLNTFNHIKPCLKNTINTWSLCMEPSSVYNIHKTHIYYNRITFRTFLREYNMHMQGQKQCETTPVPTRWLTAAKAAIPLVKQNALSALSSFARMLRINRFVRNQ